MYGYNILARRRQAKEIQTHISILDIHLLETHPYYLKTHKNTKWDFLIGLVKLAEKHTMY